MNIYADASLLKDEGIVAPIDMPYPPPFANFDDIPDETTNELTHSQRRAYGMIDQTTNNGGGQKKRDRSFGALQGG